MGKKNKNQIEEISGDEIQEAKSVLFSLTEGERKKPAPNEKLIRTLGLVQKILDSYTFILLMLQKKNFGLKRLKALLFGKKSEKSSKNSNPGKDPEGTNSGSSGGTPPPPEGQSCPGKDTEDPSQGEGRNGKKKRKGGGGRNGQESYTGATELHCLLCAENQPGKICPACGRHKLYPLPSLATVRLVGSAPVLAVKFLIERSGCVCGAVFTGQVPEPYQELHQGPKYSPSALSAIIHQKYDLGVPFGSLEQLQRTVGVPLPATSQANKIKENLGPILAVYDCLEGQGANMDLIGMDDTKIRILEGRTTREGNKSINGFGSVFVCNNVDDKKTIVLYRFDFDHAGKFLLTLLGLRDEGLPLLKVLCDGLPSYEPYLKKGVLANKCNVHSRRPFFLDDPEGKNFFCALIVTCYQIIFKNEKFCRENDLPSKARQEYHAQHSRAAFKTILRVCLFLTSSPDSPSLVRQRTELGIPDYLIPSEPNSEMYRHAKYILDRWKGLTNFTRIPGIPIDTNYVERMIKAIIEIRVKGLFFKTLESAREAGKILSVLETAKENGVNSFDHIRFLLEHPEEVKRAPENFLPWNYQAHRLYSLKRPLPILPERPPGWGVPGKAGPVVP